MHGLRLPIFFTMKMRLLFLLSLLLLAGTSAAQAGTHIFIGVGGGGRGYYGHGCYRGCWHPFYGGFPIYPVNPWVPYVPIGGCPVPPPMPPPQAPPQSQGQNAPVPFGFVDGHYLRSPWSSAMVPLSSVKHGQTVYDSNTGAPFMVP